MGFRHYSPPTVVLPPKAFHRIRESWHFYSQDSSKLSQRQQAPVIKVVPFHYRIKKPQTTNCGYKDFFPIQQRVLTGHLLGWGDSTHTLTHTDRSPSISSLLLHAPQHFCFCFIKTPQAFPFFLQHCSCCLSSLPRLYDLWKQLSSLLSCTEALIHSSKSYGYPNHDLAAHSPKLSSLSDTKWSYAQR